MALLLEFRSRGRRHTDAGASCLANERIYASQSYSGAAKLAAQAACIFGTLTSNQTNRQRIARAWLLVMTTILHGQPLTPYSTSSAASLRQLRAPRHFIRPRLLSCIKSKATSTTEKQQQTSEKAQQPPTASQDTTHVQIKTGEPTDPAHVANGSGAKGADMEVDSVLAKELSENGTLYRRCSYYGDKYFGRRSAGVLKQYYMMFNVARLQVSEVQDAQKSYVP